jgi:non-ribosomal peptide synthetase component F
VDFAAWEETMTGSAAIAAREDYWLRQLNGVPVVLAMPAGDDTAETVSGRPGAIDFTISERLVTALTRLAESLGVTPFVILFAAFQTALTSWTGQRDFLVGVPAAARRRLELQNVVGLFVNMLAIRSSVWGDPTFEELVQRVGAASADAFENQDFPFQRLVELINPPREPHTNPLVQVSFQLIDDAMEGRLDLPGVDASRVYALIDQTPFDLEVDVTARGGLLACLLHYCGVRLHAKSVAQLSGLFETVIADALTDPRRRVSELGSSGSPAKAPR